MKDVGYCEMLNCNETVNTEKYHTWLKTSFTDQSEMLIILAW